MKDVLIKNFDEDLDNNKCSFSIIIAVNSTSVALFIPIVNKQLLLLQVVKSYGYFG